MPMSEYVAGLRERVGHDLLLLPAASACVFDDDGRVLLVRHVDNGMWAPPGGGLDPDEAPADAAVREVREELGLEVTAGDIIGAYGGPNCRLTYPNGDEVSYLITMYACTAVGGELSPDRVEIDDARYVPAEEMRRLPLSPWVSVALPDIAARTPAESYRHSTGR